MFFGFSKAEADATVFLYHLSDRIRSKYEHTKWRHERIDKIGEQIRYIQQRIEIKKYSRIEIEMLEGIRSTVKDWDGNHYLIYVVSAIIDFLKEKDQKEEKLKETTLGYCFVCNEYFWDYGETICPNYSFNNSIKHKGSIYEIIKFREIKKE